MEQDILDVSKIKKLLFLGPNGSYSDFAKNNFIDAFNINCVSTNLKSISAIIKALKDENSQDIVAVIPIENSIDGIVRETLDNLSSLKKEGIKIIAETTINIRHALVGFGKKRDVKTIRSHTQALAQCKQYILANFPDTLVEEATLSTSSAIRSLKECDTGIAAIGSVECANMYEIPVIEENINDEPNNKTRFILLGKFITPETGKDKTSITFSTENKAGALSKILTILDTYNINMSYIDSRPSKKELGEYLFYIDFEGHVNDEKVQMAFADIKPLVKMFYVIGSYSEV
jgi:prephenate dehydratase